MLHSRCMLHLHQSGDCIIFQQAMGSRPGVFFGIFGDIPDILPCIQPLSNSKMPGCQNSLKNTRKKNSKKSGAALRWRQSSQERSFKKEGHGRVWKLETPQIPPRRCLILVKKKSNIISIFFSLPPNRIDTPWHTQSFQTLRSCWKSGKHLVIPQVLFVSAKKKKHILLLPPRQNDLLKDECPWAP